MSEGASAELFEDAAALRRIEPGWRALAESRGNAFLTPEWFETWLRHHPEEVRPAVAAAWRPDGELLGVLPLVRHLTGRPRSLHFGGSSLGDHFAPAAPIGEEAALAAALAPVLPLGRGGASTLVLDNVERTGGWWEPLQSAGPGLSVYRVKDAVLPYTDLSGLDWEGFLAGKSRNFRRDLKRKLKRLEEGHELSFRCTTNPSELPADLEALYELHDLRWAERGGSSAADERTRAFLADFAAAALERGWLRLWTLSLDGRPVAARLMWLIGSRLADYYTGFDPRLEREGVGFVLVAHALRDAIEEGAREFDMLLGDEAWKSRFASGERQVSTVVLVASRHPARLLVASESGLRGLAGRLPPGAERRVRSLGRFVVKLLPTARRR